MDIEDSQVQPNWEKEWIGMPEFSQEDMRPYKTLTVSFTNEDDINLFSSLIGQKIFYSDSRKGVNTRSIHFPKREWRHAADKRYDGPIVNPKYPVYIISKGRWESRLTSKALELMNVPYRIVVEPQEYEEYAKVIDPAKILTLPFSNLGQGGIPARNWVWEHSISEGHKKHWILDDNISSFLRRNFNLKIKVTSGVIFKAAEDFIDRYENVVLAGFHYDFFAPNPDLIPAFMLNSRIYSCILIQNDIPYRWRGRYNEDTDLSLRALKDGWCTILFNAFLQEKATTMTMKGGNTDELYKEDGRLKMAESLKEQHPDVTKIVWKWNRWQHYVDYKKFKKNKLKRKEGIKIKKEIDNYGMNLIEIRPKQLTELTADGKEIELNDKELEQT